MADVAVVVGLLRARIYRCRNCSSRVAAAAEWCAVQGEDCGAGLGCADGRRGWSSGCRREMHLVEVRT